MDEPDEEIVHTDAWCVIDAYFEKKGLVRQQIDSFNEFIDISLQEVVTDSGKFTVDAPNQFGMGQDHSKKLRALIEFDQVYVTRPTFTEADGSVNPITPQQARLRNLTYSVALFTDVRIEEEEFDETTNDWIVTSNGSNNQNGANEDSFSRRELIGKIPIMLRSDYCVLKIMDPSGNSTEMTDLDDFAMTELGKLIHMCSTCFFIIIDYLLLSEYLRYSLSLFFWCIFSLFNIKKKVSVYMIREVIL